MDSTGKIKEQELSPILLYMIGGFGDFTTTYTYDGNGKISTCTVKKTSDNSTVASVTYGYYTSGNDIGKIKTETIARDGRTITNTFNYSNGKISSVSTATT